MPPAAPVMKTTLLVKRELSIAVLMACPYSF
jgi:hypothetical protein